ncbi:MAG TPA: ABC transporter permease [Longimicrobiales bacterium]
MLLLDMISSLVARLRSLWGLRRRADFEAAVVEEFDHHIELRTEDLIRRGLGPKEARRRARIEFGHIETHRERARASRGLHVLDRIGFSWLDVKLGVRMLGKYPGLSLVSVLGMSVAIAIGAGGFGFIHALMDTELPLDEGERVVSLQNSDVRNPGNPDRHSVHDFVTWRDELRSVGDLTAYTTDDQNLLVPGGISGNVRVAEMTASGFRVARVAPLLGRPLLDEDERAGEPLVVVIAHSEWQHRFSADPEVIGRTVRLNGILHTVVGVMPEGFHFPINHHYWVPLRLDPDAYAVGEGPEILLFGRLADGVSIERAQAELTTIGRRMAASHPATHAHLRPWITPYVHTFLGVDSPSRALLIRSIQYLFSLLMVVVAVNVSILMYARTAARTGEIAVRTALGASRRRIVTQLFAEALVLSLVAAAAGLAIAGAVLERSPALFGVGDADLPFWMDIGLSPALVTYVLGMAVVAAAIVGVAPALKATGHALQGTLKQISAPGSRMRLGRGWTALIVAQVAVAVAVLPYALHSAARFARTAAARPAYPVEEIVRASLAIQSEGSPRSMDGAALDASVGERFAGSTAELVQRLDAEPSVAGVAVASSFPGEEVPARFEVEGTGVRNWLWVNQVDVDLFDVFDVPVIIGRAFSESDAGASSNAVIVDRAFVEHVLGGGDALGQRVRQIVEGADDPTPVQAGPWLEIVGVVRTFTLSPTWESVAPKLYRPLTLDSVSSRARLMVRVRRDVAPVQFLARLREITADVDPALRFAELKTASAAERERRRFNLVQAVAILAVTGSVLLLSGAGIYAMMSFTVARRRREIGIRAALGAGPRRLLRTIFARAGVQLGAGVLGGLLLAEVTSWILTGGSLATGESAFLVPLVAAIMVTIGLLAALGPARRGLAVQPTEALRQE